MLAPAGGTDPFRLPLLDLVRGVAVLGILAINLGGFAGPIAATLSPNLPTPGTPADEAWFALTLVLFEGKMRALFTLLFGASLLLFIDRADTRGLAGEQLQFRRLGWLALFGYLHFLLLWWGDILFTYAIAGFAALAFRHARPSWLIVGGVLLFSAWHLALSADSLSQVAAEQRVLAGHASPTEVATYRQDRSNDAADTQRELANSHRGFLPQIAAKLTNQPEEPLRAALNTIGESLPLMLLGMGLFRTGLFSGQWPRRRLVALATGGIAAGGAATLAFTLWAWQLHFPPVLMLHALASGLALPHLLMGLGYAALIVLAGPALLRSALGQRLVAAGRMAFSNYIGMTVVMTALFYGWGLDLIGRVPERWLWPFLLAGWLLMLGWSQPWLARFRHGPLEWAWRVLTYWRIAPFRR